MPTMVFPFVGLIVFMIWASFHHLCAKGMGDRDSIGKGPIPGFCRNGCYHAIGLVASVEHFCLNFGEFT